jgi:hypothetical protein
MIFFNINSKKINVRFHYTKINLDQTLIEILKRNFKPFIKKNIKEIFYFIKGSEKIHMFMDINFLKNLNYLKNFLKIFLGYKKN